MEPLSLLAFNDELTGTSNLGRAQRMPPDLGDHVGDAPLERNTSCPKNEPLSLRYWATIGGLITDLLCAVIFMTGCRSMFIAAGIRAFLRAVAMRSVIIVVANAAAPAQSIEYQASRTNPCTR